MTVIGWNYYFQAANKAHKFFKGTELEKLPVAEAIDSSPEENSKLSWRDFGNSSFIHSESNGKCSFSKFSFAFSESPCTQINSNLLFYAVFEYNARFQYPQFIRHGNIYQFQLKYLSHRFIRFYNINADCVQFHFLECD